MLKEYNLEGKVAIATGAGRGLGRAIALTLAEAGADVVAASRTARELEQTADGVRQQGRKCLVIPTDVTDTDQVNRLVEKTMSELRKVDILMNNAGAAVMKALIPTPGLDKLPVARVVPDLNVPLTEEERNITWSTNVNGVFRLHKSSRSIYDKGKKRKGH